MRNTPKFIKYLAFGLILALAVFAAFELQAATPFGAPFGSDSVTYLTAARNLAAGRGLGLVEPDGTFRLLPYTPPFYPLVLSLFAFLRLDLLQVGFWLNVLIFAGLVLLFGWAGWHFFRSGLVAVLLAALVAFSGVLIDLHAWVMSDPLGLLLGLSSLVLLGVYLDTRSRRAFFGSAVLGALAWLTRYAGVAFCLTGVLGIVLLGSQSFRKRLVAAGLYGLVSALPMAVWLIIDLLGTRTVGSRTVLPADTWLPRAVEALKALKLAAYLWLPYFLELSQKLGQGLFRLAYFLVFAGLLAVITITLLRLRKREPSTWRQAGGVHFMAVCLVFLLVYLVAIVGIYAAVYPPISLTDRMFAPLHAVLLILVGGGLGILYNQYRHWIPRLVLALVMLLVVGAFYQGSRADIAKLSRLPLGYTIYRDSPLIAYLQDIPPAVPLISDKAPVIQYYLDRPAYPIQEFFARAGQEEFSSYGSVLDDEAQRAFREQGGLLVLFASVHEEFSGLYGEQAGERYQAFIQGLILVYRSPEGDVFRYPGPKN